MRNTLTRNPLTLVVGLLLATAYADATAQSADAGEAKELERVVVTAEPAALNPDAESEQHRLDKVPGGTNLVEPQKANRLATLKDTLNYQPGVVVQEFFGGLDQPRLNIRGSGIQSNPVNRGVVLLQDGLPLNEADGSFVISFLEPRNAQFISIRRGANAISPSATSLGGELDFSSLTGSDGDVLRMEGGSFGRLGLQVAKGFRGERLDGRLSVSDDRYDGFRHFSDSSRRSAQGSFGVEGERFENRTYLSFVDFDMNIPFVVTRDQMHHDPRQLNGEGVPVNPPFNLIDIYKRRPHRESSQFRIANRSWWGSQALNNSLGVYAQTIDDMFQDPISATASDGHTYGAQWQLAGESGRFEYRMALDWARSDMNRDLHTVNSQTGAWKVQFADYDLQSENRNLLLEASWQATSNLSLVAGTRFSRAIRDARNRGTGVQLDQAWNYTSPKLGMVWVPAREQRLYANLSRSNEAPTYWEIVAVGNVPNPMIDDVGISSLRKLEVQQADTFEVGGDGRLGSGEHAPHWALSLYHSNVDDELMSVSNANGTPAGTYNYRGGTRHRGVELGLNGSAPLGSGGSLVDYRLAWTLGDFRFKGGEYAGNHIAGVPRQLVNAEVLMRFGNLRLGPNVSWMPQSTETNHANLPDTQQDPYTLLGFKLDYQRGDRWNLWLQADNLADKTYASAFVIRNMAPPVAPTFLPGNGRSFSAGFRYAF